MAHQTETSSRKKIALVNEFVQSIDFTTVNSHFSTFESQKIKKGVGGPWGHFWSRCCFCCPGIFLLVAVDKNVLFVLPT